MENMIPMIPTANLIARILKSVFFEKATGKAGRTLKNTNSLLKLLRDVLSKSKEVNGSSGFSDKLQLLVRMLKAYASGEYKAVPWGTLLRVVAVLIYFLSPLDLIPDLLPVIGLTDDIALVLWLANAISDDLEAFSQWEKHEKTISIG